MAFGRAVESLGGRYVTAEDVGMSEARMKVIAGETRYVSGLPVAQGAAGGDPGPYTAHGVYLGVRAAARRGLANLLGSSSGSIRNEIESLARRLNVAV